jgi:hypothetical protein
VLDGEVQILTGRQIRPALLGGEADLQERALLEEARAAERQIALEDLQLLRLRTRVGT